MSRYTSKSHSNCSHTQNASSEMLRITRPQSALQRRLLSTAGAASTEASKHLFFTTRAFVWPIDKVTNQVKLNAASLCVWLTLGIGRLGDQIAGREVVEEIGMVSATAVRSKSVISDMYVALAGLFGGECGVLVRSSLWHGRPARRSLAHDTCARRRSGRVHVSDERDDGGGGAPHAVRCAVARRDICRECALRLEHDDEPARVRSALLCNLLRHSGAVPPGADRERERQRDDRDGRGDSTRARAVGPSSAQIEREALSLPFLHRFFTHSLITWTSP